LPAIKQTNGLELVGVYNRTKSKAEKFAASAGLSDKQVYDSIDSLINDANVDAIDALLPVQYNYETIKKAVDAGKPIAIEKPIAATIDDAKKIVSLANSTHVPVLILENFVHHQSVAKLKELLPRIGKVVTFTYSSSGPYAQNKYHETAWRRNPEHVGGYLSDGGVHQLAVLTEVLGEVESVSARAVQLREVTGDVDTLNSLFNMKSGVFGTFLYGSYFGATEKRTQFTIFGVAGSLVFELVHGKVPTVTLYEGENAASAKDPQVFNVGEDDGNGVPAEFANFAEAVRAKDKSLLAVKPEAAFHHFAVVVAAVLSAQKNGAQLQVERP
jgi:predicted dehydrogenase